MVIVHEVFAHRDNDRLLAAHVSISRPKDPLSSRDSDDGGPVEITFDNFPDEGQLMSDDIAFERTYTVTLDGYNE